MTDNEAKRRATQSVRATAQQLEIGINQAYEAVRAGQIPAIKIGKRYHVLTGPLERMLAGEK